MLPEVVMTLKAIPTAAYATPTTAAVPQVLRQWLGRHDALVLARHGAVTVGRDLSEAYNRMEKLSTPRWLAARLLGQVSPLPPEEVQRLLRLAGGRGQE